MPGEKRRFLDRRDVYYVPISNTKKHLMGINADKPYLWKADVEQSIDFYNDWFIRFAPSTYRKQRVKKTQEVSEAFKKTNNLKNVTAAILREHPGVLPILRMITAPPLARDRLIGLAYVSKNLVASMEGSPEQGPRIPSRMSDETLQEHLGQICDIILELADKDLFPWLETTSKPKQKAVERAAMIVADRLCGAATDPIIRNAQERRQLSALERWLSAKRYSLVPSNKVEDLISLEPGTFTFRLNVPAGKAGHEVNIPIDCVIKPQQSSKTELPLLIEAKSAGDATNTNKRRKEEAQKFTQLKQKYGLGVRFVLLLCGYFEPGYLGYEASEGIDWMWEHRLNDLEYLLTQKGSKKKVGEERATYESRIQSQEATRSKIQSELDAERSAEQRNKLGQFSTPYDLAQSIVGKAISYLPAGREIRFLEPALGTGVFYSALKNAAGRRVATATGIEIDSGYETAAKNLWGPDGLQVVLDDYLNYSAGGKLSGSVNLICTNPPYVRHHHLAPSVKIRLQARIKSQLGLTVSGLSGLYLYFLLISHELLEQEAIASWLIPSEFLFVNYGEALREYLLSKVTLLEIHQFDPEEVQFEEAWVSSCIVTYRKSSPTRHTSFRYSYGGSYVSPSQVSNFRIQDLKSKHKWLLRSTSKNGPGASKSGQLSLGELFDIKRGIATGSNDFFIIDEATIQAHEIPAKFIKPVLPSPRYLSESIVRADDQGTPKLPKPRFLLNCTEPPSIVKRAFPKLWAYLESGERHGIPLRYLCAGREVWYYQEKRAPAQYLASYMGRSNGRKESPFRFFLNQSKALVTNVFLNLYPKPFLAEFLNQDARRWIELLETLNSIDVNHIIDEGREYGGGLHKIEPKELANVRLSHRPIWLNVESKEQLVLI